jgi:hypothetical protein
MRCSRELGEAERPSPETRRRLVLVRPSLVDPVTEHRRVDSRVVDELCAELAVLYPDPVDVFEDAVAERLGLRRHPGCDLDGWRRARVRAIDALEDGAGAPRRAESR